MLIPTISTKSERPSPFTNSCRLNPRRRAIPLFTPFTKLTHQIALRLVEQTHHELHPDDIDTDGHSFRSLPHQRQNGNHRYQDSDSAADHIAPMIIPVNHTAIQIDEGVYGSQLSRVISMPLEHDIRSFGKSPSVKGHIEWLKGEHSRRFSATVVAKRYSDLDKDQNEENEEEDDDDEGAEEDAEEEGGGQRGYVYNHNYGSIGMERRQTGMSEYEDLLYVVRDNKRRYEAEIKAQSFLGEFIMLMKYAIPLIVTFLLDQSFQFFSVVLVGQLGTNELAAISLSTMIINIIFSIFEGIATSLDTLCPQSYGSGDLIGVGVHFQRCTFMSLILCLPFGVLWYISADLMRSSGIVEDLEVLQLACTYQRWTVVALPAFITFETLKRFLQAQGLFDAATYVLLISTPLNCLLSYYLVIDRELGFVGAAIATNLNAWSQLLLLVLYVLFVKGSQCWGGFTVKALQHWTDLFKLSLPGVLMFLIESFLYEIMTLLASNFGTKYLAIQTTATTITSLLYTIPFSLGIAASTRIANFIGESRPALAQNTSNVAMTTSVVLGVSNMTLILLFPLQISQLFSNDVKIIQWTIQLLPLVAISQTFDSLNAVAGGCLRGQGMQRIGSVVTLLGYAGVGVPIGWLLAYHYAWKLTGLWWANLIVLVVLAFGCGWSCCFGVNWDVIMKEAKLREIEEEQEADEFYLEEDVLRVV